MLLFPNNAMTSRISAILNKIHDVDEVNSLLVSSYIEINKLAVDKQSILSKYIIVQNPQRKAEYDRLVAFKESIIRSCGVFSFEMLIEFFEFVVSPSDKIVTGAIYTPKYIREAIVDHVFRLLGDRDYAALRIADIACGCGGFFLTIVEKILRETELDCHYIYKQILYGCDIEK